MGKYQLHLKKELDELNLDQIDQEALEQQYNMYSQSEKIVSLIGTILPFLSTTIPDPPPETGTL